MKNGYEKALVITKKIDKDLELLKFTSVEGLRLNLKNPHTEALQKLNYLRAIRTHCDLFEQFLMEEATKI